MAVPRRATVFDASGTDVGHVDAVLGDENDDIFHGISLNLKGPAGAVELASGRITRITTAGVYTDLGPDEAKSLPKMNPDHWFEFEGVTRVLKRSRWHEDR
jgi:hypothetical protein